MNRIVRIALGIVILVVVAGASFYGGMIYGGQQAEAAFAAQFRAGRTGDNANAPFGQGGQGGFFRGAQGGGVFGQIARVDGNNLVVTTPDDSQVQVQTTDTTLIEKYATVTVNDLAEGDQVIVSGSKNDDGSVVARSVQVVPAGRFAPGGNAEQGN